MKIDNKHYRTIWEDFETGDITIIDQRILPHEFKTVVIESLDHAVEIIRDMYVRGAPLIGATAAYAMHIAAKQGPEKKISDYMTEQGNILKQARPTAINLNWAVDEILRSVNGFDRKSDVVQISQDIARRICEEDVGFSRKIGTNGARLIEDIAIKKGGKTVNILTHCNAGWLATVDWGTATAPIYTAHKNGIDLHVWVDETRPRNQGAKLTAWELSQENVPNTLIVDNAGGHLMQHGMVDIVIVGSDRTTATGDVANKIGTYLKALASKDNSIPFYVALPSSSIDFKIQDGITEIPIEQRSQDEVLFVDGVANGKVHNVRITSEMTKAANYAFDVTPARLVDGLITERGICKADEDSIKAMFPDKFF